MSDGHDAILEAAEKGFLPPNTMGPTPTMPTASESCLFLSPSTKW